MQVSAQEARTNAIFEAEALVSNIFALPLYLASAGRCIWTDHPHTESKKTSALNDT